MKTIGYTRVSTSEQDVEKFENQILRFANEKGFDHVDIISEKVSGSISWKKRLLGKVVEDLQKDDVLVVPELSRIGRSLINVLEILDILSEKGVKVFSIKENFQLNGKDMQSKIMRTMIGLFSEIERDLISLRTKEGLEAARASGKSLGRPKGKGKSRLDPHKDEIVRLLEMGCRKAVIAERFGSSHNNFLHWLKMSNLDKIEADPNFTS